MRMRKMAARLTRPLPCPWLLVRSRMTLGNLGGGRECKQPGTAPLLVSATQLDCSAPPIVYKSPDQNPNYIWPKLGRVTLHLTKLD